MAKINVKEKTITIISIEENDYVSITDIAKYKNASNADDVIKNWMRNRNTIELLGLWEKIHNPEFKPVEFDGFRKEAGLNSFVLSPKRWIETTNAIGIISKFGRNGGYSTNEDFTGCGKQKTIEIKQICLPSPKSCTRFVESPPLL